jgi:hypothetical protein
MQPDAPLILELEPTDVFADATKPLFVPWTGQFVSIVVPVGTPDGTVMRIPGLGAPAVAGGPPQDAFVQVRVKQSPYQQYGPPPQQYGPPQQPQQQPYGPPPVYPPQFAPMAPAKSSGATKRNTIIGTGVAAVLLVACCGVVGLLNSDDDDEPGARPLTGGPAVDAPAASPEEYQAALTKADTTLATAFRSLGAAKNPKAVETSATALSTAIDTENRALVALAPPAALKTAHTTLTAALRSLGDEMSQSTLGDACLGSAATSAAGQAPAARRVRTAASALATADPARAYTFGSFVPKATPPANRKLGNATYLKRTKGGAGRLEITNGSNDSVVSVVPKGKKAPAIRVYVQARKTVKVTGVKDGTYEIFMTDGKDWDAKAKAFSRDCAFQKFDDSIKFTTKNGMYSIWKITITEVVGGNASRTEVDPDAFPTD